LRAYHPDVNIDSILQKSQMTKDEVSDTAHWFTREQADRFSQVVMDATGNDHIARQAWRSLHCFLFSLRFPHF
jgi:two-component system C4-dicarboxylate transport sensor histidine kinase DctB